MAAQGRALGRAWSTRLDLPPRRPRRADRPDRPAAGRRRGALRGDHRRSSAPAWRSRRRASTSCRARRAAEPRRASAAPGRRAPSGALRPPGSARSGRGPRRAACSPMRAPRLRDARRRRRARRPRPPVRRAAPRSERSAALDPLGLGGEGDDGDVAERLGPDPAEADDERGDDAVGAGGDDQLDAGRGHALDQELGARGSPAARGGAATRRSSSAVARQVRARARRLALVAQMRAGELQGDRPAELARGGDAHPRAASRRGPPAPARRPPRSAPFASASPIQPLSALDPGASIAGRRGRDLAQPRRARRRRRSSRAQRIAVARPATERHARARRAPRSPRRRSGRAGSSRRAAPARARSRPVDDARRGRRPRRLGFRREVPRVVVAEQQLVDRGVVADRLDDPREASESPQIIAV